MKLARLAVAAALMALPAAFAQSVTVPMIVEGNAPIIEVQVRSGERVRTARFLIDTGAGAVEIGSKVMADVAAVAAGPESNDGGDRIVPLQGLAFSVGGFGLDLRDVKVIGLSDSVRTMARNATEGILSASVLRKYRVIFDYPGHSFTIAVPGGKPRGQRVPTAIAADSGYPRILATIGGKPYGFLLDTGASFSMLSRSLMDEWSAKNPRWPTVTGAAGFANMVGNDADKGPMLRISNVKIGTFSLADVAMVSRTVGTYEKFMSEMMSEPIVGAIAGNILRDFRVEIDYQNGATYFERESRTTDNDLVSVGLILALANNGDPVITALCSAAGEDVKSGVQLRDRLIAVDGKPVNGLPLAAIAVLLSGKAGTSRRLTLKRNGQQLDVTVTTRKLL
jgi:predicted aspartyl protease